METQDMLLDKVAIQSITKFSRQFMGNLKLKKTM